MSEQSRESRAALRVALRVHLQDLDRTSELIAALRKQVQAERQAHAETRRLLASQGRVEGLEAQLQNQKRRRTTK